MAREIARLSFRDVIRIKSPGLHADGAGLYLAVRSDGSKSNPTRGEQENDCKSSKTDGPAVASPVRGIWLDFVALFGHAVLSG